MRTADIFTTIRLLCVPIVMWLILSGQTAAALGVYAAALVTDILDGYFARKDGPEVSYGPTFDALTDITLVYGTVLALAIRGEAFWLLVGGLIALAYLIPLFGFIAKRNGGLTIPHLNNGLLALAVHTAVIVHIAGWSYAQWVLPFAFLMLLIYGRRYYAFARSIQH